MRPAFVDTHVHYYFPDFDEDRADSIKRARDAGLQWFINVGTGLESSQKCLELARTYPDFFASAGLHPHDAKDYTESLFVGLCELLRDPKMVAVGEVGLDFFRDHSPQDKQFEVFEKFVLLSKEIDKPLIVHCRDAYEPMLNMLKQLMPPFRGVMHCYSSDKETMFKFLDLGFDISFAGPLTYKKNLALREACEACPLDRLHFETDAPFLPPEPYRGKRNETAYILQTLQMGAQIKKISLEALSLKTIENAQRLFDLK